MGNPEKMRHMQADYYSQVCKRYGFAPRKPKERFTKDVRTKALALAFVSLQANSGLHDDVINALLKPHYQDPSAILEKLDIPMPKSEIKGTFAGLMTKKVKPDKPISTTIGVETSHSRNPKSKPIVVDEKNDSIPNQPLLSVGVQIIDTVLSPESEHVQNNESSLIRLMIELINGDSSLVDEAVQEAYQRESESNHSSDCWDESTGEFVKPPVKVSKKSIIRVAVDNSLKASQGRETHRC
jgi:hypothetical protein